MNPIEFDSKIQYLFFLSIVVILLGYILVCVLKSLGVGISNPFEQFTSYQVPVKGRKFLILYTGGTIGMVESPEGNVPKKGFLGAQLRKILSLHKYRDAVANFDVKEYDPLLDSSNMSVKDWNKMIADVRDNYDKYDGFIIIHGTDTLSYTASALSFAFKNLGKPVVITGSQIPLQQLKNDGGNNLLASLILVSQYTIPEVLVVFSNEILRGNRSKKISSNKLDAFDSPNMPHIGNFGYAATPNINNKIIKSNSGIFSPQLYNENIEVSIVFLTPGFNFNNVRAIVERNPKVRGVVLQTFGIGDGPTGNDKFLDMLKFLNEKNIVILNISQCIEGHIDTGDYETGKTMLKYQVISGNDMTLEAGYCKLLYLLTKYNASDFIYPNTRIIEDELTKNLRGELSENSTVMEF